MKKVIRLKQNQTYIIMDGNGILHEITTEQNREVLTIEQIVNSEAGNMGCFAYYDEPKSAPLSGYHYHYTDTHTREQAEKLHALAEIMRIADYYNEHYADGWKQDNDNLQQMKYVVFNKFDQIEPEGYHFNMFGLPCFATQELAQLAIDNNKEVFERFFKV